MKSNFRWESPSESVWFRNRLAEHVERLVPNLLLSPDGTLFPLQERLDGLLK